MLTAVVFLVVVTGAILGGIYLYSRRINGTWADVARELDLTYKSGGLISGPKIVGTFESVPVEVTTVPDMTNGYTLTRATATYPTLGVGFRLEAGSTDLDTSSGDAEFDTRFTITTDAPKALPSVLTPDRRAALLALLDTYPSLEATDTDVSVTTTGTVTNPDLVVAMVRDLVATAKRLTAG